MADDNADSDWRASRATQPFDIYPGSWGSDFADASNRFNQNFTQAADHYRNHWNDPKFDALVAKAQTNTNAEERNQQYSQALYPSTVLASTFLGDGLRDALDPWMKR